MREVKPDIAIVTTMSLIEDVKEALMLCAKLGVNAITTCEEAFYPQNSNPVVTRDIDELAKKIIVQLQVADIKTYIGDN